MVREQEYQRLQELGDFLRTRRARLAPKDVGLPRGSRRRAPGLRRAEVAQLAGVSVDWYIWLEQGRPITVSTQVLESLVQALHLDANEREHLFFLAHQHSPPETAMEPETVSRALQHFLDHLGISPAFVSGRRWDIVAWNEAACIVFGDFRLMTTRERNTVWRIFTSPTYRQLLVDWEGHARRVLAQFRTSCGRFPGDPRLTELIHDLMMISPEFRAWWPDHEVLGAPLSSQPRGRPNPEVKQVAQAFLTLLPDVGHVLPDGTTLPTLTPLDPEQEKRRRFEILAHFLTSQTRAHPVLLVVEDLHWSDDTSLEFLHYLARRCSASPLLLLLTYRSDEVRPSLGHFLAQLDRERLAQEITLARLTRDEVEAMLRAIFALQRSARVELADPIFALTEGNPFFVEETLKSLMASGEIYYADGRWQRKELRELHIPRSVQDAVRQRTDQLSESARRVLTLAAVAGRRFDFGLLQQLTHDDEQHLLVFMKELIAAQLVVEESAEQFAFRHALTRQVIHADLLVRERKALHRNIADTMEHIYTSTLDAHLADLAYHFFEAGAWVQALAYGQRAGEQAQRLYAPHAAVEQVTRALDAAEHGSITPPHHAVSPARTGL